jgi:hypothetical protein
MPRDPADLKRAAHTFLWLKDEHPSETDWNDFLFS